MTENVQYPLRERRKRRTRNALINAAAELFHTQGYEETTLEEIAERAEVHVQTLYRHFPAKEALALAPDRIVFERFREAIDSPERAEDTLKFWRAWVERYGRDTQERFGDRYLKRARTRENVPSLVVASLRLWHEYEDLLTEALARDMGVDAEGDRRPRLLACMLWGGHQHAVRRWALSKGKLDLSAETLAVVDDVIKVHSKSLGARPKSQAAPKRKPAS